MSLDRFKTAQAARGTGFDAALAELRAGRKTSHWIWYIFPQLAGLGHSATARFYALQDLPEAEAYLDDPVLHARLRQATEVVAEHLARGAALTTLMGGTTDCLKLVSSLTLFRRALETRATKGLARPDAGLADAIQKVLAITAQLGFPPCRLTLARGPKS